MQYRKLGASDLLVSDLCLGTMTWGNQNTLEEAHEQLNYAFDNGINFLDAAEMYPVPVDPEKTGRTESIIGEWLKTRKREDVIVATKIASRPRRKINRENIQEAVEKSLKRLQTDYIDLYQIHWPDRYTPLWGSGVYDTKIADERRPDTVPIEEQVQALAEQVQSGKIRYIGLSNETAYGLTSFQDTVRRLGLEKSVPIVSVQNAYSLLNRVYEYHISEVSYWENIGLLAYSPLAFGLLTGKYADGAFPDKARLSLFPNFGQRYARDPRVAEAVSKYCDVAKKFEMSPAQMALAFCRQKWFVASTIIGATTMDQLKENMGCVNVVLPQECLDEIQAIYKVLPDPAP